MNLRPRRLRGRLLLANLIVAGATLGTVLIGVSLIGPGYFQDAMGHRAGDAMGQAMDAATLSAFQEAVRTALVAAAITALVAAVVVSLALSTRIAGPVTRLVDGARRIAAGHYAERVPLVGEGEVGELASAFNQMSTSLEATERRRLELVGDVAHELRTPLTTLDGYLEGLQDGVIDPTQETWTLLRNETGRRHASDAGARQIALRVEPGSPAICRGDRDRVVQIIGNYLSNALRYAPTRSTVTLSVAGRGDEVVVTVRDEGPGLPGDQLAHLFDRFYRADPSRSRALGGSGIGLAIVRALAEAMGGRAWATSGGPGSGSAFHVALPAA